MPPKRPRSNNRSDNVGRRRPSLRSHQAAPPLPLNPIPTAPTHNRPALQLFGWGDGTNNQLGLGPIPSNHKASSKPRRNVFLAEKIAERAVGDDGGGLESIAAGGMHSLVIDESGTVWSFGVNEAGALGRQTVGVPDPLKPELVQDNEVLESIPHPVQALLDQNFRAVKIACTDCVSAAISTEGDLQFWGSFNDGNGTMGFSVQSKFQHLPIAMNDFLESREIFSYIAGGANHLLALTINGNVYALGNAEDGQLGRKVVQRRKINGTRPEKVVLGNRSRKAVVIGAGSNHSFAVDTDGGVWGWGLNSMGQTGTGRDPGKARDEDAVVPAPAKVIGLSKQELGGATIVEISGGNDHTMFLTSDGRVYVCGATDLGQSGLADTDPALIHRTHPNFLDVPTEVTFPHVNDAVVHIAASERHNLAITASGVMYVWGEHNTGGLGLGEDCSNAPTPTVVVRRDGSWRAEAIACRGQHCLALLRKR